MGTWSCLGFAFSPGFPYHPPMADFETFAIAEYAGGAFTPREVGAIREVPLTIRLNGREVVTLLCTGKYPEYLTAGFLRSDGLLSRADQIAQLRVDDRGDCILAEVAASHDPFTGWTPGRTITSGGGRGLDPAPAPDAAPDTAMGMGQDAGRQERPGLLLAGRTRVTPDQILALAAELRARSTLYRATRGCHNSSLCLPGEMLLFREDIGRHNAIDILSGQCLLEGIDTSDKLIVTTGRVASEILLKAARMGVPMLASVAVATAKAASLARDLDATLVGNVGEESFWVYHDPGRIAGFSA
jgi:FdhD protein